MPTDSMLWLPIRATSPATARQQVAAAFRADHCSGWLHALGARPASRHPSIDLRRCLS